MHKITQTKWFTISCLILILVMGGFLRFKGINWDQNYHLHPDERFLTMVETSLSMVDNLSEYFDTDLSTLNPHNVVDANGNQSFPFFVYGNFPIILIRFVGELINQTGYSQIHIIGRYLSGIFDLGTILIIFLIGKRLFKNRLIGLLAAFFYSFSPLPIQISHFFIVDNFTTFFGTATIYFAVNVFLYENRKIRIIEENDEWNYLFENWKGFSNYFFFALTLGLAVGSKLNAVALSLLLPIAVIFVNYKNGIDFLNKNFQIQIRNVILAGILSFIFFRIFQPYAFSGPNFYNLSINPKWWGNIQELRGLSSGISNYPPSLQWTRRTVLFPLKNMFVWGMGPVFGLFAIIGLIWMILDLFQKSHKQYILILTWNMLYIAWQAIRWNPTMRYFLLAYPTMALSSAWGINRLINIFESQKLSIKILKSSILIALLVIAILWGFAFINIYKQPMTRIAASEWIYKNVEGPINLHFSNDDTQFSQPIQFPKSYVLSGLDIFSVDLKLENEEIVDSIAFDHVRGNDSLLGEQYLDLKIINKLTNEIVVEIATPVFMTQQLDSRGGEFIIDMPQRIILNENVDYSIVITSNVPESEFQFLGSISLVDKSGANTKYKRVFEFSDSLEVEELYRYTFSPFETASLQAIELFRVRTSANDETQGNVYFSLTDRETGEIILNGQKGFNDGNYLDVRGSNLEINFDRPVLLNKESSYEMILWHNIQDAELFINGSKIAKETDWDDALPLFMYGMNPFDLYTGVYQSDLNFQMYWEDNTEKYTRFSSILDQTDYIIMSSNRQWGSLSQAPEKYPLSNHLYQGLLACNSDDLQKCYINATDGSEIGALGFELVETFHVQPEIFGINFNSQNAEEAFTVYDHPKVFIFEKTPDYSFNKANNYLDQIDLSKVLNISPGELEKRPGLLELDEGTLEKQELAGTWSGLFNTQSLLNESQLLSTICWYLLISFLGWISYPITRLVFNGLLNKGWGISRIFSLILFTYVVWMIGSIRIPVKNITLWLTFSIYIFINVILFIANKSAIINEIKNNWKDILLFEGITLVLFVYFLLIRIGNPDLWHPYKGGEKPMDFSYFNAVLKSETFPPYDPWYAGGYINYYYWGFMLAAVPTRFLGIIPSVAYNLTLASFFSFTGISAFTIGLNLSQKQGKKYHSYLAGFFAILFVLFIGNLGTIKMIINGFLRLGQLNAAAISDNIGIQLSNFINGIATYLKRGSFTYYPGDWYWIPSRSIPGEPITEFPYFTFLYGDPHAHLFAYPITLVVICWSISMITNNFNYRNKYQFVISLLTGAILVGALRVTNTWDFPVFLAITVFSIVFSYIKFRPTPKNQIFCLFEKTNKTIFSIGLVLIFIAISFFVFHPFTKWYGAGYTSIALWDGNKTPIGAYILHWGIFLFMTISWLVNELINWMKITPISYVAEWLEHKKLLIFVSIIILAVWVFLVVEEIFISIIVIPIILVAFLLVFQKDFPDRKRIALLFIVLGYGLTLLVEVIVLTGDIGRMNTVFKFYLQAWTCLSLASAIGLSQSLEKMRKPKNSYQKNLWNTFLILLIFSGLLYPVVASVDKITDRMASEVPLTIDGMDYMQYATYIEGDTKLDLSQDYALIRWMQENIEGTPTIIEANTSEYRWGSRVSIYTGLPGVIGWNWHQRQQRNINPDQWIFQRVNDVEEFYSSIDILVIEDLINKYSIDFVVVGQLERAIYPTEGLAKFTEDNNNLFESVYSVGDTTLYKVNHVND